MIFPSSVKYNIQPLFPTAVLNCNIGRNLTDIEIKCAQTISNNVMKGEGNYQTLNTKVLELPEFKEISDFINGALGYYVNTVLKPDNDLKFYITQSWINYTRSGEYHHKHCHPNSILSGVFYFNTDSSTDKIVFEKPNERIYITSQYPNIYNSKNTSVKVSIGDLIIFPSELEHYVPKTVSSDTRVSLAFNTFARGIMGTEESLTLVTL